MLQNILDLIPEICAFDGKRDSEDLVTGGTLRWGIYSVLLLIFRCDQEDPKKMEAEKDGGKCDLRRKVREMQCC